MKRINHVLAVLIGCLLLVGLMGCEYTYPYEEEPNNSPSEATFIAIISPGINTLHPYGLLGD